jgi:predicted dehydrogenase/GNAT superfamily N-acetyltransferase
MQHTRPLRLGILGCARIAHAFARDVGPSPHVQLVAVASRSADKARAFAKQFGIERAHASYEALLADDGIDAVYNPLPNSLHAPWTIEAVRRGKHVLCEKPLAPTRAQALAMFDAAWARGVFVLEAYPYWFQPRTAALLELLRESGPVRSMQACFGFTMASGTDNIRWNPVLGGGALLDAGSYPVSLTRLVMGQAPRRVWAQSRWAERGVDVSTLATLEFDGGRHAQIACAMDVASVRRAVIATERATIETDYLNHTGDAGARAASHSPGSLRVRRGVAATVPFEDVVAPSGSGFRFAAEAFAAKVAARDTAAFERAARASIDIATTLEAIAWSAREQRPVDMAELDTGDQAPRKLGWFVAPGDFDDPQVRELLRVHLAGMQSHTPAGQVHALDLSGLQRPDITFLTLWDGARLLGCGAIRALASGHAEIKSMRTHAHALRRGVGAAVLQALLKLARQRGLARVSLETGSGDAFEPALALYRRHGFASGPAFGDYVASDFNQFLHLDLR